MEEIIKLIESTEIYKNSISHNLKKEYQDYHYDIDLKIITELHKKAKALQLQQTGVKQSVLYSIVDNGTVLEKFKIKENAKNALKDYKINGFPYAKISKTVA